MRVCAGSGEVEGVGHFVLACEDWQSRVENEHYSVAYFDRITTLET